MIKIRSPLDKECDNGSAQDEEIVGEWLISPENEIYKIVQKRLNGILATSDMPKCIEIPTGLTPESDLGQRILKVARKNPKLFQTLIGMQSSVLQIASGIIPVNAEVTDIMDVDNDFSVRPEVVITLGKR